MVGSGSTQEVSLPPSPSCYDTKIALEQNTIFFKSEFWVILVIAVFVESITEVRLQSDYPAVYHPVCKLVEGHDFSIV